MFKHYIQKFLGVVDREKEIVQLKADNLYLRKLLSHQPKKTHEDVPIAGFDSVDCEPSDDNERKDYISEVSNFYDTILQPKLKVSIAEIRQELSYLSSQQAAELALTREQYDFFMRGMEAGLWKINDWCLTLQGERRSRLQEEENNK